MNMKYYPKPEILFILNIKFILSIYNICQTYGNLKNISILYPKGILFSNPLCMIEK